MNKATGRISANIGDDDIEIQVDYTIWPAEPMVMHDRDGGGYPGSPAECEIQVFRDGEEWSVLLEDERRIIDLCFEDANERASGREE